MLAEFSELKQFININISKQTLIFFQDNKAVLTFLISSAIKGTGQQIGSEKTPLGKHIVRAKIGTNLPVNAVLKGRRYTGEIYNADLAKQFPDRDWILSRILWLSGSEVGRNRLGAVDSMRRYIYIHGTPDTEPMGIAESHGCIRMRNKDVIQLYDQVHPGCSVNIF